MSRESRNFLCRFRRACIDAGYSLDTTNWDAGWHDYVLLSGEFAGKHLKARLRLDDWPIYFSGKTADGLWFSDDDNDIYGNEPWFCELRAFVSKPFMSKPYAKNHNELSEEIRADDAIEAAYRRDVSILP